MIQRIRVHISFIDFRYNLVSDDDFLFNGLNVEIDMNFLEIWDCLQRKHVKKFVVVVFFSMQARLNTWMFFIQYFVVTNPIQSYCSTVELLFKDSAMAHNTRLDSATSTTDNLNSFIKFDEMSSVGNAKEIINSKIKDKWINALILHRLNQIESEIG